MMKNITIVTGLATATIAGVLALSACSTTTEDIHNSAAEKGSLDVPLPYSVVYEDVAKSVDGCIPTGGTVASHTWSRATQIEPGKLGRVEGFRGGVPGNRIFLSIDIKATPTGTTHIDYFSNYYSDYYGLINFPKDFKPVLQAWVAGKTYDCGR